MLLVVSCCPEHPPPPCAFTQVTPRSQKWSHLLRIRGCVSASTVNHLCYHWAKPVPKVKAASSRCVCFPAESAPHSSPWNPQITGASHWDVFILEGADCLSSPWAETGGIARCSSSNRVISFFNFSPRVYQSAVSRPHVISCLHRRRLKWKCEGGLRRTSASNVPRFRVFLNNMTHEHTLIHFCACVCVIQVYAARCGGWLQTGQPLLQRPRSHLLLLLRLLHQVRCGHLPGSVHPLSGVSPHQTPHVHWLFSRCTTLCICTRVMIHGKNALSPDPMHNLWCRGSRVSRLLICRVLPRQAGCRFPLTWAEMVSVCVCVCVGLQAMTPAPASSLLLSCTPWSCWLVLPQWPSLSQACWSYSSIPSVKTCGSGINSAWTNYGESPQVYTNTSM